MSLFATIKNPITNRTIKITGATAKKICKMYENKEIKLSVQDAEKCKQQYTSISSKNNVIQLWDRSRSGLGKQKDIQLWDRSRSGIV